MASRKKDPAALRTISFLTGKTPLEEASLLLDKEEQDRPPPADRDIVAEAEEAAVRWFGLDAFHQGDDVKLVEKNGRAVILLVDTSTNGQAYGCRSFALSRPQYQKLKALLGKGAP